MKELKVGDMPQGKVQKEAGASSKSNVNERGPQGQRLKATWESAWEPGVDEPSSVSWEDGRAATLEEFHAHEVDTHFWAEDDNGKMSKFMFPEIVGDVVFDRNVKDWVVQGPGVVTTALALEDPNAQDDEIIAALHTPRRSTDPESIADSAVASSATPHSFCGVLKTILLRFATRGSKPLGVI